ncbi:MAG: glutathione peroxidase [Pseudohongiellaceae bacterium]|jgi:glutathione peroxidase
MSRIMLSSFLAAACLAATLTSCASEPGTPAEAAQPVAEAAPVVMADAAKQKVAEVAKPKPPAASDPAPVPAPEPKPAPAPEPTPEPEPVIDPPAPSGLFAFDVKLLDGSDASLSDYAGQVALVVNVASRCGFTPQYEGLQALADEFAAQGLVVLGFPSNEFGGQEPDTPEEIAAFCTREFGVTFPMFEKCEVRYGPDQSPVYAFLEQETRSVPNWNFCKYLIGRDGQPREFYLSPVKPSNEQLRSDILNALSEPAFEG